MQCPKCKKGELRVFMGYTCSCGHHPMICQNCHAVFMVKCGAPTGPSKLPPEHPIEEDKELTDKFAKLGEGMLTEYVNALPTVEEFKKTL